MKRFVIYSVIIITIVIGVISYFSLPTPQTPTEKTIATLTGDGKQDSPPFKITQKELLIFRIKHQTSDINSYFNVSLYGWNDKNNDKQKDNNEISLVKSLDTAAYEYAQNYNSSIAQKVSKGQYFLRFDATGSWQAKIVIPKTGKNISIKKFKGHGTQATNLFYLKEGKTSFQVSNLTGKKNFQIFIIDKQGNIGKLLVNEVGVYNGNASFNVNFEDEYLLQIKADGDWEIKML